MMNDVVVVVGNMIRQVFTLSFRVFDGLGATELIFGAFSVYVIYRFLLSPLFGRSAISNIDSVAGKLYRGSDSKADSSKKGD